MEPLTTPQGLPSHTEPIRMLPATRRAPGSAEAERREFESLRARQIFSDSFLAEYVDAVEAFAHEGQKSPTLTKRAMGHPQITSLLRYVSMIEPYPAEWSWVRQGEKRGPPAGAVSFLRYNNQNGSKMA